MECMERDITLVDEYRGNRKIMVWKKQL